MNHIELRYIASKCYTKLSVGSEEDGIHISYEIWYKEKGKESERIIEFVCSTLCYIKNLSDSIEGFSNIYSYINLNKLNTIFNNISSKENDMLSEFKKFIINPRNNNYILYTV